MGFNSVFKGLMGSYRPDVWKNVWIKNRGLSKKCLWQVLILLGVKIPVHGDYKEKQVIRDTLDFQDSYI